MPNQSSPSSQVYANANVFHRAIRTFAATRAGEAVLRPTAHRLDQLIAKLTRGRGSFAKAVTGVPAVILTVTGAKSGQPRTVAVFGIPHPDGLAVIASNFGDKKHPGWYHNLKANPAVTVASEGDVWPATARLAAPQEFDEIWAKGIQIYPGWQKYVARAGTRQMEAFVLSRN
jgi:deazaflavin-dependent oxidoreductase (nitroreductase family)